MGLQDDSVSRAGLQRVLDSPWRGWRNALRQGLRLTCCWALCPTGQDLAALAGPRSKVRGITPGREQQGVRRSQDSPPTLSLRSSHARVHFHTSCCRGKGSLPTRTCPTTSLSLLGSHLGTLPLETGIVDGIKQQGGGQRLSSG